MAYSNTNPKKFLDADGLTYFSRKLNNYPTNDVIEAVIDGVQDALDEKVDLTSVGAANGVAELGADGKIPSNQLPSYVDDIIEVQNYEHLPYEGESGKIYVTLDTNMTYRWTGSDYVEISPSLALGETSSTAYRGDRGKTAYDHATEQKASTTASGLYKIAVTAQGHVQSVTNVQKSDITALGIPGENTTYTNFIQSGSTAAAGLVPAPSTTAGTTKYLREDGTWSVPPDNNTTYTLDGLGGAPKTEAIKAITRSGTTFTVTRCDGTTFTFTQQDNNTTYGSFVKSGSTATAGLVPSPGTTAGTTKYLREDATWQVPPDTNTTYSLATLGGAAKTEAIKNITRSGTTFTVTRCDNTTFTFNQQDSNTTYTNFVKSGSTAAAGLVPSPGTTAGTTKYLREDATWQVPPDTNTTYSLATLGGAAKTEAIKNITRSGTTFTATRCDNTTFTFTQQDNNTTYTLDGLGGAKKTEAIKTITRSGTTFTATRCDGTTFTFNQQDNNTTYANMTAATASAAGKAGLVPAPAKAQQGLFLRGDATWQTPTNTTYANMTAATASAAGKAGLVPAPAAGKQGQFLRGDATWATPTNTTYTLDGLGGAKKTEAVKTITRSGTTFTATRCDGTTFSFTQQDNNTTYSLATLGGAAKTEAIKKITRSGTTFTATRCDNTTFTFTQQDNNTTYANMKAASSSAAGSAGLVPAPAKGKQSAFLRGDATWNSPFLVKEFTTTENYFGVSGVTRDNYVSCYVKTTTSGNVSIAPYTSTDGSFGFRTFEITTFNSLPAVSKTVVIIYRG